MGASASRQRSGSLVQLLGRYLLLNNNKNDRELKEFANKVTSSIKTLRDGMQILSLGINYQQYAKFRLLTPSVVRYMDGKYEALSGKPDKQPTAEQCRFCYDFVIACASHIQNFDFEVEI